MTDLKKLIEANIDNVKKGNLSELITYYQDYKNKYAILNNEVIVKVRLKEGKEFEINLTEYFEEFFENDKK